MKKLHSKVAQQPRASPGSGMHVAFRHTAAVPKVIAVYHGMAMFI